MSDDGEKEDRAYVRGRQAAYLEIFRTVAMELDFLKDEEQIKSKLSHLLQERHFAIDALRTVCGMHGDNDWPDNLYLPDIIEKHLGRQLDAEKNDKKE
jgi:hypothetical protein